MRVPDVAFRLVTGAAGLLLIAVVGVLALELVRQSRPSIEAFGLGFWSSHAWDPVAGEFGAFPFIWGALYSSVLALAVAVPVSIGMAVFIVDLAPAAMRAPFSFVTELLAAIPSVVYGLWGLLVLAPAVRAFEIALPDAWRRLPLFSGPPLGVGMLSAGLILAIMVVPVISTIAREVLQSVPPSQREAAYALGATRFEAIRATLHHARTGIVAAVLLGFGRAFGETMAVTMVIGNRPEVAVSVFAPQHTMAAVIANEFTEAVDPLHLSALVEIGLVLFVITLAVNAASRVLIWTMSRVETAAPLGETSA